MKTLKVEVILTEKEILTFRREGMDAFHYRAWIREEINSLVHRALAPAVAEDEEHARVLIAKLIKKDV